ncbi:hypothetical protein B0T24DRAFT_708833 [Lasiosphaeria ovina]|uniref:Zn(2)-C6 fungal-type domain-containing protein n=1 Tax=Lasiosphaeria ovina TaxID=92902 RepID=A0AAE0N0R6_9PEZI|nr:hypothetical protein B0T24DRAFT_708833 [Lasiosphaeria ovina]
MAPPNTLAAPAASRRSLKRKACLRCTKLKRKCDKPAPFCSRCPETGIACHYPPLRNPLRHLLAQLQGTSERLGLVQIDQALLGLGAGAGEDREEDADADADAGARHDIDTAVPTLTMTCPAPRHR